MESQSVDHKKIQEVQQTKTYKTKFEVIAGVITLVISLVALLVDVMKVVESSFWITFLRILAWLAFIGFGILLVFILKQSDIASKWKTISLISFFVLSNLFFTWIGSWFISPQVVEDARVFTIEQGAPYAISYQGVNGTVYSWIQTSLTNRHVITSYELEYDLPEYDSYAGISLYFPQPIDISGYTMLEFKISFGCPDARLRIVMKETEEIYNDVYLGDGKIVGAVEGEEQLVRLDLDKYFPTVNHKSIRKIDLDASGFFIVGKHKVKVSEIRFLP